MRSIYIYIYIYIYDISSLRVKEAIIIKFHAQPFMHTEVTIYVIYTKKWCYVFRS